MSSKAKEILEQVASWPEEDQNELAEAAREIAARRTGLYELDDNEETAIRDGMRQLDRGEMVTEAQLRSFWKRCGVL